MNNTNGFDCCYSDVEVLADDTVVSMTYGNWVLNESPFIVSIRFKLSEIDKFADHN